MIKRSIAALVLMTGCFSASAQGLKLFSPAMRDAATYHQQVVMDFMERYFGTELPALKHTTIASKMADDKVYFRKGSINDLYQVSDTMSFSISLNDKYYEVEWKKKDAPFVTLVFPAQYDLLLGMHQEEAQQKLKDAILAAPQPILLADSVHQQVIPANLVLLPDSVWQSKTDYFELESLNDATYYNNVREDFKPVFDKNHLEYSAANLFHGLIEGIDYRMYVELSVYGMKTINYTLSFQQWLNYCAQLRLKVYFAVEEQREDGILALIIVHSQELGFNHLLSVIIPDKFVSDRNTVLKVRMTPYIPTHNVKKLYQQETANHKKKKW